MNGIRRLGLCGLAVLALAATAAGQDEYEWKAGKWVKLAEPAKGTPAGELAIIRRHFEKGWNRTTVRAANKFVKKYPIEPESEEVMSLAGRAEIRRGRYFQAYDWFEKQITQFPNGQYFERALEADFEIANAFLAGKKRIVLKIIYLSAREDGLMILERIVRHAPGSSLAEKSLIRIADYHFQKTDYDEAVQAYDQYLEVFSRSERASYAMLQAARARHGAFRGIRYDSAPLLDAQQRYRMFAKRFPLAAERANVPGILEDIRSTLAHKIYAAGEFYERIKRTGPAKFYYKQVIRQYPQTQWEARSRQALLRLGEPVPDAGAPPLPASTTQPAGATIAPAGPEGRAIEEGDKR
ncbi:MAG TPA: outer membrane protein assembly factor BamD [Phycisphaerae bacterium]|nr:outer membrane protein assembly factor BamD [Phycisphaerae bacterium]